eukprot:TRINITY_DN9080_c0_g1_i12.p1 TRINITY_DN9080_c0_g1~~TRINITY_DN9080_c0_g1_i12.p1  ORF type:complete len:111 (-),score=34.32 TRINITY_DN9080_c0_g1_i12:401-733(-)
MGICSSVVEMWLEQTKEEIADLKRLRSEAMPQLYDKLMATVLVRCYMRLNSMEVKHLINELSSSEPNINVRKYVDVDLKYYANTEIDLNLTDEERNLFSCTDKALFALTQ